MLFSLLSALCFSLGFSMSPSAPDGDRVADGKMLLFIERQGEGFFAREALVLPGARPLPEGEGNAAFKVYSESGVLLDSGPTTIPRFLHHDGFAEGRLTGARTRSEDRLVLALPYHRDAARLELLAPSGEVLLEQDLACLDVSIRSPAPPGQVEYELPDFSGFFREMEPRGRELPHPHSKASPASNHASGAAQVSGSIKVRGLADSGRIWAQIEFYDRARGAELKQSVVVDGRAGFTTSLDPGDYLVRAYFYYYDPDYGDKPVWLHPFPYIVTSFDTDDGELTLEPALNDLFLGRVAVEGGEAVQAKYWLFEAKLTGSTFQRAATGPFLTGEDGRLGIRLPPRKFLIAVLPVHQDRAVETLQIISPGKDGSTTDLVCPASAARSGAALKQLWGDGNRPFPVPAADYSGKLNLVFLADAYTEGKETFTDRNGNGAWDGDLLLDVNGNGELDDGEYYNDRNGNGSYDKPEPFQDENGDGVCNRFERAQFELDCALTAATLLNVSPFSRGSYARRINIFCYWMPSKHGVQRFTRVQPWQNMETALGSYCSDTNALQIGSVDYYRVVRAAAEALPDYTVPIAVARDPHGVLRANAYFNFGRILISAETNRAGATLVHELGHSIGGLGDEYTYSGCEDLTYYGPEPSYANLTAETDPRKVKWRKFIKGDPPVPTPFGTDGYGIFEGGDSAGYGLYRPTPTSMMRDAVTPFFKVNEQALKKVIKKFQK